jgi:hypothetical protein
MPEKRMFTKKITESDAFLEMPLSSQCLYFHLNMYADDDGFVNSPRKVMKIVGASDDDLKILITKNFILVFDSGVIVIKHWRMHNTLQNDRYHPTDYQEEFAQLGLKTNKAYTWKQDGNILYTELNVTKHNITRDIYIDLERMKELGLTEEAEKLERFIDIYSPTKDQYRKIREAVFDPNVRHIDQYVERIMNENQTI